MKSNIWNKIFNSECEQIKTYKPLVDVFFSGS